MILEITPFRYTDVPSLLPGDVILYSNIELSKEEFEHKADVKSVSRINVYRILNSTQYLFIGEISSKHLGYGALTESTLHQVQKFDVIYSNTYPLYMMEDPIGWIWNKPHTDTNNRHYMWKLNDPNMEFFLGLRMSLLDVQLSHKGHDVPLIDIGLEHSIKKDLYFKFVKGNDSLFTDLTAQAISKIRTRARYLLKKAGKETIFPEIVLNPSSKTINITYKVKEPKSPPPEQVSFNRLSFLGK